MTENDIDTDDIERYCQLHEDRRAVLRLSAQSAADTPLVRDLCEECAKEHIRPWPMFGIPPGIELIWLEDVPELREWVDDVIEECGPEHTSDL